MNDLRKEQKNIDNHIDDHVDEEIKMCFSKENPKSFFVFAGAGSGKTRSLINVLSFVDKEFGNELSIYSKQVAVITYTNAACDEISKRLNFKSIFAVSTIHSFIWDLIKPYQLDIKSWIIESIESEIAKIVHQQSKGRTGTAEIKRQEQIEKKKMRLKQIYSIKKFSYNPNGENIGYESLNHSEIIKMGAQFIAEEETMQKILVGKYPILFIDESQDTKKDLIDALLLVSDKYRNEFIIGMFGDTMQRIYQDGKENLSTCIPDYWSKPEKIMNHRSAKRIVELANTIRNTTDNQKQRARSDAKSGIVRLFVADISSNKEDVEQSVRKIMAETTEDKKWLLSSEHKSLILEHHMAASRFGFSGLYTPLNNSGKFDTSLRDGSISELSLLSNVVSPLVKAHQEQNDFEISKIIRQYSPLFSREIFLQNSTKQREILDNLEQSVVELLKLWDDNRNPNCIEILQSIKKSNLFLLNSRVDELLSPVVENEDVRISALREALSVTFDELERYSAYVTNNTPFATHQGVKGLEFPRVMVIMDDSEARGFLFSYEKLFGAKDKTDTDIRNERDGRDTGISRTARLFYVACTRAEESLAVVAYTENKNAIKDTAILNNWFSKGEIEIL